MSARPPTRPARLGPNATRVAAFTAMLLATAIAIYLIDRSTDGTYEMRAQFDDVRGLIPGGDVTAGAVEVGTVTAVEFDEDFQPVATFEVDDDFRLHEGAIADIRLGSNVGAVNRVIDLSAGDPAAPELAEGSTLSGASTDQPVNFDQAIQTFNRRTRERVRGLLAGLERGLADRGDDINAALRHAPAATNELANLLAQAAHDGAALRAVVRHGERVSSALARRPAAIGGAVERTASLLRVSAGRQRELRTSVELLGPALARTRATLERLTRAAPNLRRLVAGLRPVVDAAGPLAQMLPPLISAAAPFLRETRTLVLSGPRHLRRLEPIVSAAGPIARKLTPVVRRANPLGQELRVYAPEIIGFFQNFGAATGAYDANGHLLRTAVGNAQTLPPSTASDRIGPDECKPGLLELPFIRLPGTNECLPWRNFEESFIGPGAGG